MNYRQCTLRKGKEITTSWIPESFAVRGKFLKLKNGETWDDGWKVACVGARQPEEYVLAHERDYRTQRQASDI